MRYERLRHTVAKDICRVVYNRKLNLHIFFSLESIKYRLIVRVRAQIGKPLYVGVGGRPFSSYRIMSLFVVSRHGEYRFDYCFDRNAKKLTSIKVSLNEHVSSFFLYAMWNAKFNKQFHFALSSLKYASFSQIETVQSTKSLLMDTHRIFGITHTFITSIWNIKHFFDRFLSFFSVEPLSKGMKYYHKST